MGKLKIVPKHKSEGGKPFENTNVIALPKSQLSKYKSVNAYLMALLLIENLVIIYYVWNHI